MPSEPTASPSGPIEPGTTVWWEPGRSDWQVAALFIIGSACFMVGSIPGYVELVGATADGVTYFVGSIFFTLAALLQLLISAGAVRPDARPRAGVQWRSAVREPQNPAWWAGVVQFGGTLLFNVSTFSALHTSLTATEAYRRVWTPDALGSVAFLVASGLAFSDVAKPWLRWRPADLGWRVAMLNMVGSIAFGASAVAAYVVPTTGDLRNAWLANVGTLIGAVCFLVGALYLIPDQEEARPVPS